MKKLWSILIVFCTLQANAQPFSISFAGSGLSTVKVQNLTTGMIVDVPAGDVLLLSPTTGITEVTNLKSSGLKVYPNPMTDISTLVILPPFAGDAIISIYDISGKLLTQFKSFMENVSQEFTLSGVKRGLHIVNIQGNGYQFSEKLLCTSNSNKTAIIERAGNNIQVVDEKNSQKESKGIQASVDMAYNSGERLKYTAISGTNSTVMTDIPTATKVITFIFSECKDGDNNYYPVVQIGTQLWMAENLKTTKYNDGKDIPNVTGSEKWVVLTTGAYCNYDNSTDDNFIATYGRLYNWYAVNTGKLAPVGWHVPTDAEWTQLTDYLGGVFVASGKLKESVTTHWFSPNEGATNETGFSALPGGYRFKEGTFANLGRIGYWWSATSSSTLTAYHRFMTYSDTRVYWSLLQDNVTGYSIRCVKD
jgi:uncharacterized protein (TIGR02145 family)